jgi:pyruvate/2-oxoglutarate dehydrogenase complex dihydrolipoamide dehydrogenase (E3) component
MAQAFARLGTEVHVLQRSGQILSREDTDMAEGVRQCLEREGVRFYLRVAVQSVRDLGGEREVRFTDDSGEERSLRSERLLVALGREANVGELALDRAGVEHTRKGIPVDERMRTSQSHIYAAGDVTGRHLFTHAAGYEGGIIVSNAAFHIPRKADYTYMPRCTYTDPEFAVMGVTEKQALEEGRKYEVWTESFRGNDRSLAEGEEYGWIKMLLARSGRPLGVQILGPRAGELLSEWVAVLGGGVKLTTLASAVHPYPTLAEVNKSVAGNYLQPKIFSKRMTTALSLLFNFKGRACKT